MSPYSFSLFAKAQYTALEHFRILIEFLDAKYGEAKLKTLFIYI